MKGLDPGLDIHPLVIDHTPMVAGCCVPTTDQPNVSDGRRAIGYDLSKIGKAVYDSKFIQAINIKIASLTVRHARYHAARPAWGARCRASWP